MDKIIWVGDPHLDNQTPESRLDDYKDLSIDKLNEILDIAVKDNVKHVIFTGDMFDKYEVTTSYLTKVVDVFRTYLEKGVTPYSLIGNHDLPHNKMEYFERVPLNLLFKAGVVKHLTHLELDNVELYGLDFTKDLTSLAEPKAPDKPQVLTAHYAIFDTIPNESIKATELKDRKINLVVCGHDHNYYTPIKADTKTPVVLRPGSMIRRTKDAYNLVRYPLIYLVTFDDKKVKAVEEITISTKKADEVFKSQVFNNQSISSLTNLNFGKAFEGLGKTVETLNLVEILNKLLTDNVITQESFNDINKYLNEIGYAI